MTCPVTSVLERKIKQNQKKKDCLKIKFLKIYIKTKSYIYLKKNSTCFKKKVFEKN